jgi:hypothetical protein
MMVISVFNIHSKRSLPSVMNSAKPGWLCEKGIDLL